MTLYDPREPIHPRAFALRHAVLEEVKARRHGTPAPDPATEAALVAAARAVEVAWDADRHGFAVRAGDAEVALVPLADFRVYERRPADAPVIADRTDPALAANRALAARLLDGVLARLPRP